MNILWSNQLPSVASEFQGCIAPGRLPASYLLTDDEANKELMKDWDWDTIIWKKVRQLVFNLQKRIYKATKAGKYSKAKSLMYLLQNSKCGALYAVRKVTTDNTGKRTPGIDFKTAKTPKDKIKLVKNVLDTIRGGWDKYRLVPAKRVMIPKANGKMRPLGIPTIKDRAMQAATKLALEPYYEAKFESCSFGFRPGMGCHDAIDKIASVLVRKQKWILDADIKGFFDNIDHNYLVMQIDSHWRPIVKRWLKAGYVFENETHQTEMGTPQGGTISPLLANMALDQMETDLIEHLRGIKGWKKKIGTTKVSIVTNKKTGKKYKQRISLKIDLVRYADDFVVIHEDKEVIEESKSFIEQWLQVRGLTLSQEKTKIIHSTEGFDFLGHHIRHYENQIKGTYKLKLMNGTKTEQNRAKATHVLRVEPTKDKIKAHWREVSDTIWKLKSTTAEALIGIIQPKITGWANYYKTVHSSEAFGKLDTLLWKRLYQWARRRHPQKGKKWIVEKYFGHSNGRNWVFMTRKDKAVVKAIRTYSKHKERTGSYAKVGYDRSFYDGDTAYWADRLSKGYGNITPSKAKMLKKQDGICPECKSRLTNEDLLE
ncbi:MAG: group II intron reverse transcriptase/maturase, partial [Pseudomonadota bacterium]